MDAVLKYIEHVKALFLGLSSVNRILALGGVAVLLSGLGYLTYTGNRVEYTSLYTGLAQNDLGEITQSLKAKKIPYRLGPNSIEVPREQLYEVRMALASEGVPKGAGMGFELFDQQKLGSTDFVQKINYQRALQGELARTINGMDEVAESRVHLVLAEESLFQEDKKPSSAAVVIKLKPGTKLDQRQTQGIVNLVVGTVRGLEEDRVTILSTDGKVLFKKDPSNQPMHMTNMQIDYKNRFEDGMRQKVQSMLEQVLGANRVLTRISADMDFNTVQIAEETYNPDGSVIRSQQRSIENSDGAIGAKGNPDVPINVESKLLQNPQGGEGGGKGKQASRTKETVNYEINKVNRQIVQAPGTVKKLSVAVILDGPYDSKKDADGNMTQVFKGRTPEELKSIEDVVKKAVGYSEGRGDQITVSNIPFVTDASGGDMVSAENKWVRMLKTYQKPLFNLLVFLFVFLLIVRPFMKKFSKIGEETRRLDATQALPPGEGREGG